MPKIYSSLIRTRQTIRSAAPQAARPGAVHQSVRVTNKIAPSVIVDRAGSTHMRVPKPMASHNDPRQMMIAQQRTPANPKPAQAAHTAQPRSVAQTKPEVVRSTSYPKMLGRIRFRIVVPVYNAAPWIAECLRSIASQTYKDFECVVKDDASSDSTVQVVNSLGLDDRFRISCNKVNLGPLQQCLNGFDEMGCEDDPDAVLMIVDGDDRLCRNDALSIISRCYKDDPELMTTYGNSAYSSDQKWPRFRPRSRAVFTTREISSARKTSSTPERSENLTLTLQRLEHSEAGYGMQSIAET